VLAGGAFQQSVNNKEQSARSEVASRVSDTHPTRHKEVDHVCDITAHRALSLI
jgi:hypothetical protein